MGQAPPRVSPCATEQIFVCDPLDPHNNLADRCQKMSQEMSQVRAMLKYCHMALVQQDAVTTGSTGAAPFHLTHLSMMNIDDDDRSQWQVSRESSRN